MVGTYTLPDGEPCDLALPCAAKSGLTKGGIAGVTIGLVVVVVALAGVVLWLRRRNKAGKPMPWRSGKTRREESGQEPVSEYQLHGGSQGAGQDHGGVDVEAK